MTASIWTPGSNNIPVADPNTQVKSERFTATEGQTTFVLANFTYHPAGGALEVYVQGIKKPANRVYEISSTTFVLADPCEEGDIVEAVGNTEMASADGAALVATEAAVTAVAAKIEAVAAAESVVEDAAVAAQAVIDSETVYAQFEERFLGPKNTPPTLNNTGGPLTEGVMYWNTVANVMFVYTGSAWQRTISDITPQTLTGPTISWDWNLGNGVITLGANATLNNPTNMADGDYRSLRVTRTGAFGITSFGSMYKGLNWIIQGNINGVVDHFVFRYNAATNTCELVGFRANAGE